MFNICNLSSLSSYEDDFVFINLVYKRDKIENDSFHISASCSLNIVSSGEGVIETPYNTYKIVKGDVFFINPGMDYRIISKSNLEYLYTSFVGLKAVKILDNFKSSKLNPILKNADESLINLWVNTLLNSSDKNVDLLSRGLFYYTIASIFTIDNNININDRQSSLGKQIKKIVDEHYNEQDLNLEKISNILDYSTNYLSLIFKKENGVNFNDYLNTLRIVAADNLIQKGFTSIKEIANLVGYSDPLYFSKVYKKKFNFSPKESIQSIKTNK